MPHDPLLARAVSGLAGRRSSPAAHAPAASAPAEPLSDGDALTLAQLLEAELWRAELEGFERDMPAPQDLVRVLGGPSPGASRAAEPR